MAAVSETGHDSELRSSSIGLADVLFQAMTYMAPGVGLAFSIGIAVPISGATLPLSVIVALIACTFCAVSIGQMATRIPSAGGLYTYAAKGIGPKTGFLVGWFYVCFGVFLPGSLLTLGGWFVDQFLEREVGFSIGWWFWGVIFAVCIFMLTYFDVRISAKATIVLGAVEIVIFLALAVTMVFSEPNSAKPFTPSAGADAWNGIFQGAVFAILAFIGFEAASALGEEAKNPKKVIPQGVIGSCVLVGLFYVFQTYAWNVGAGVGTRGDSAIVDHLGESGGSAWDALGSEFWGSAGAWLLFFALVNSVVACGTAATNNAARVFFAMGRSGSAPAWLGKVHPRHKSPYMSVITTIIVTGVVAYLIAFIYGDGGGVGAEGQVGFFVEATFFTVVAIIIYMIACASCLGYFSRKEGKPERNVLLHVVVPIIGMAAFILPLYTQYFSLGALFEGTWFQWGYKEEDGSNIFFGLEGSGVFVSATMGALLWVIIGILLSWYLSATRPEALERATHVFGGEVDDETPHGHADSMSITH